MMPRPKKHTHLLELAKRGAEVQLRDLVQEIRYLLDLFPHLRDSFDPDELPVSFLLARGAQENASTRRPRRRGMSPAARKAQSQRMKQYWAKQRAARKSG